MTTYQDLEHEAAKSKGIFTDENGKKYELVGEYANPGIVIQPIEQKPKWVVSGTKLEVNANSLGDEWLLKVLLNPATESQAQLIKEAVEALMEILTEKNQMLNHGLLSGAQIDKFESVANVARTALQKGNSDV